MWAAFSGDIVCGFHTPAALFVIAIYFQVISRTWAFAFNSSKEHDFKIVFARPVTNPFSVANWHGAFFTGLQDSFSLADIIRLIPFTERMLRGSVELIYADMLPLNFQYFFLIRVTILKNGIKVKIKGSFFRWTVKGRYRRG